jgi:hypothetical protein
MFFVKFLNSSRQMPGYVPPKRKMGKIRDLYKTETIPEIKNLNKNGNNIRPIQDG